MAVLHIEEFSVIARYGVQIPMYPPIAAQEITIGVSSAAAPQPFARGTNFVRLTAGDNCRFKVGPAANVSAADDVTSSRLEAGQIMDVGVQPGHFIAAITAI